MTVRDLVGKYGPEPEKEPRQGRKPKEKEEGPADILYSIARQEIKEMFRDEEIQTPYAILSIHDKVVPLNMESEQFKLKLRILYENHIAGLADTQLSPLIGEQDLNKVVQQLLARNDTFRRLYDRCFMDGSIAYYDFMNKENQYARITPEGYTIQNDAYHIFRKHEGQSGQQVLPDRESTNGEALLEETIKSFNILESNDSEDKKLLCKIGLLNLFWGKDFMLSNPIWAVNGPPGAAKTTLLLWLKCIVDPVDNNQINRVKDGVITWSYRPDADRDRKLVVAKTYFVPFDNLERIKDEENGELCNYSTGGKAKERKMRTNTDTVEYQIKGHVGYTSVADIAKKDDLIRRQLQFNMDLRLDFDSERGFWEKRLRERPAILHYIFTTLGKALPIYNKIKSDPDYKSPLRLADFILMGEAISQAMGNPEKRFLNIFKDIDVEQGNRTLDNNAFAGLMADYILNEMSKEGVEHTVYGKELYDSLKQYADSRNFNDPYFPKTSTVFGTNIPGLIRPLLSAGIEIQKQKRTNKGQPYKITIHAEGISKEKPEEKKSFCKDEEAFRKIATEKSENGNRTIEHESLRMALISSGKFAAGEAYQAITDAVKAGVLEKAGDGAYNYRCKNKTQPEKMKLFIQTFRNLSGPERATVQSIALIDNLIETCEFTRETAKETIQKFLEENTIFETMLGFYLESN